MGFDKIFKRGSSDTACWILQGSELKRAVPENLKVRLPRLSLGLGRLHQQQGRLHLQGAGYISVKVCVCNAT